MKEPRRHQNLTNRDRCSVCHDDGWVSLKGRTMTNGISYSRGAAPCKWCEAGTKAYEAAKKPHRRKDNVESNYKITDVDGYDPDPVFPTKSEAAAFLRAIMPNLSLDMDDPDRRAPLNPFDGCTHELVEDGPPQARPWNNDSIQWRRCTKCDMQSAEPVKLESDHRPRRLRP